MSIGKARLSCIVFMLTCLLLSTQSFAADNELISKNDSGTAGNRNSFNPAISSNGRYVAFDSQAGNLVPGVTTGQHVYLRDRHQQTTEEIGAGIQPAVSGDGRYVAFTNQYNIYVRDRVAGTTETASAANNGQPGNGYSTQPAISGDGRYVAFTSNASNLPGAIYGRYNLFVRDRQERTTLAISAGSYYDNGSYPVFSGDGRYVVYLRNENVYNGYGVYRYDMQNGATARVGCAMAVDHGGVHKYRPAVSYDGRYVAFPSECETAPNGQSSSTSIQVFYFDMQTGNKEVISLDSANKVRSGPNNFNFYISMDYSGRFVAFVSYNGLVPEDTNGGYDVYLRNTAGGSTTLVSRNYNGGNLSSAGGTLGYTAFSGDAGAIAFTSQSLDLVYPPPGSIPYQNIYVAALNTPPVADAGDDKHITCAGPGGAVVPLDGSRSYDPDGDPLTYAWDVPGVGLLTGPTPTVLLTAGTYTITLTVDDGRGANTGDTVQVIVEGDTMPPEIGITVAGTTGTNGWYRPPVEVTITATDNCAFREMTYSVKLDQNEIKAETTDSRVATFTLAADGVYKIHVSAKDMAGLPATADREIWIDKTPPEIHISGVTDGGRYSLCSAPVPTHTVTDNRSGVCRDEAAKNCGSNGCVYTVTAEDCAGNPSEQSVSYILEDIVPPVTKATIDGTPGKNGWYVSPVTVVLRATDDCSGVKEIHYRIGENGTEVITAGDRAILSLEADGEYKIFYWAVDKAGVKEAEQTLVIKIDKTPPVITITGPADGAVYTACAGGAPEPGYTVFDPTSGVESSSGETTGEYTYTVTATDFAGNTATKSITYSVRAWDTMQFGRPLDETGMIVITPKTNRTIPVKFRLSGCGLTVTAPAAGLRVLDSENHEVLSGEFRVTGDGDYQYHLRTDSLPGRSYTGIITIDGREQFTFLVMRTK